MIRAGNIALACVVVAIILHTPVTARAQEAIESVPEGAETEPWNQNAKPEARLASRERFLEGNRLFRVPLFSRAAEQYVDALREWQHPAFYFNLAIAQLNLGNELDAHDALQRAIAFGEVPLGHEPYLEAQKQLKELEQRLGRIKITCKLAGARVALDGSLLFIGPGSYEGWAQAKDHEITGTRSGYLSEARRVTVVSGQTRDVDLTLLTLEAAGDAGRRWAIWKPWSVIGAGALIAGASGILHATADRNYRTYDKRFIDLPCSTVGCTLDDTGSGLNRRLERADLQQRIAKVGYLVGGAVAATGVVLVYLNRARLREQDLRATKFVTSITPTLTPDTFGLQLTFQH